MVKNKVKELLKVKIFKWKLIILMALNKGIIIWLINKININKRESIKMDKNMDKLL